jgi:hypothetical protein
VVRGGSGWRYLEFPFLPIFDPPEFIVVQPLWLRWLRRAAKLCHSMPEAPPDSLRHQALVTSRHLAAAACRGSIASATDLGSSVCLALQLTARQ